MNKLIIFLINNYQKRISPNTNPHCKYRPTCSQYSKEAFMKFNFIFALLISIYRLIRCNPLSKGGYDPVPLNYYEKEFKKTLFFINETK